MRGRLAGVDTRMKAPRDGRWHESATAEAVEARNGMPLASYRHHAQDADAGVVERVCRWRRSLIAAALALELAAEQAGEQQ